MTYREPYGIIIFGVNAAVAQSVVRRIGSAEVTGPIPVSSLHVIGGIPYKMGDFAFLLLMEKWYGLVRIS